MWLYLYKEILQEGVKKVNPLRYGPFHLIEKASENDLKLSIPHVNINSIVNVNYIKLFDPSLMDG